MFTVVTKVDPSGNMALAFGLVFETSQGDPSNNYMPTHESAIDILGQAFLMARYPVFRVGEILVLDANGRDQFGRKPSKWSIETEFCSSIKELRATLIRLEPSNV